MLVNIITRALIDVVVGCLIFAVILRIAIKWVQKLDVPYGKAYVTVLIPGLINVFLAALISSYTASKVMDPVEAIRLTTLLSLPVQFLIGSFFISSRLAIPFGRACLVSLAMVPIGIAFGLIVVIPIYLIVTLMN